MRLGVAALSCLALACAGPDAAVAEVHMTWVTDAPPGEEAITCVGIDASAHAGRVVCGIDWSIPGSTDVPLHHAFLYADGSEDFLGTVPCEEPPPRSVSLGGWLPGADARVLFPDDTGIYVPDETRAFVVQAHALRLGPGLAEPTEVTIRFCDAPPTRVVGSFAAWSDVPTIAPHTSAESTATCTAAEEIHVLRLWPHMHRAGVRFTAWTTDESTPVLEVVPWDFAHQTGYLAEVTLAPGESLHVRCEWENTSDEPIEPGPLTRNEMCTMGVLAWPIGATRWEGGCR